MLTKTASRQTIGLQEHVMSQPSRVDRTAGVIRGVKILGATSKNGREYTPTAMKQAAALYENCRVNFDHPDKSTPNVSRSVRDWIGELRRVRVTESGVFGDLHLIKAHPHAGQVLEAAERFPTKFGLSHNASGKTRQDGHRQIVESIESVRSVDLVTNPATNNSLFESVDMSHKTQARPRTNLRRDISTLVGDKDLRDTTKIKVLSGWLLEMDGMPSGPDGAMPDPCADLKAEIRAALEKPDYSDEAKILEVFKIIGMAPSDEADDVPTTSGEMAEAYTDPRGYTRRQRDRISAGASSFLESIGGRPVVGTQRAKERDARVQAMIRSWK